MTGQILIPHHIWIDRAHKKAIRRVTSAVILPHDKPFVWSGDESLAHDCRLITEYIKARGQ